MRCRTATSHPATQVGTIMLSAVFIVQKEGQSGGIASMRLGYWPPWFGNCGAPQKQHCHQCLKRRLSPTQEGKHAQLSKNCGHPLKWKQNANIQEAR